MAAASTVIPIPTSTGPGGMPPPGGLGLGSSGSSGSLGTLGGGGIGGGSSSTTTSVNGSANPNAAMLRLAVGKLVESFRRAMAQQRPWSELTDRANLARPDNVGEALSRISKNLGYFRANYLAVLLAVVVLSMLWNPTSILYLALLSAAWAYVLVLRTAPLVIAGRVLSDREKAVGMGLLSVLVVFGLTSVGSVLISGVVVGLAAICTHAACRVPDDLFLDESADAAGGFAALFFGTGPPGGVGVVGASPL